MSVIFSVIIPVYQQLAQLKKTLNLFADQTIDRDFFEIILVNDGSTDCEDFHFMLSEYPFLLHTISIRHAGSAHARNVGAKIAKGSYLVFCDADRMPDKEYLSNYLAAIQNKDASKSVFQGRVMNCFAVNIETSDYSKIVQFSRDNQYYHKIMKIYEDTSTQSGIKWASYMVGNSCISKVLFEKMGGFDSQFLKWGFEHFDLGIRLMEADVAFISVKEAINYHIPHSKEKQEYVELFQESIEILNSKYPQYHHRFIYLLQYLCGEISLQEFEYKFSGSNSEILASEQAIFYRL